jgi:hypothetical protein
MKSGFPKYITINHFNIFPHIKSLIRGCKTNLSDSHAIQQIGFLDNKFNVSGYMQTFRVKGSYSANKGITKAKVAHQRFQ